MVRAKSLIKSEERESVTKTMGTKTQMVVRAAARTGMPISRLPSRAAVQASCFSSKRFRKIFSKATTAGSTSMPMATISPIMDIRLRVMVAPKNCRIRYMVMKTQRTEMGMAEPMMRVLRKFRRKIKMIEMARMPPRMADWERLEMPFVTSSERSRTICARTLSLPTSVRMPAISALTRSAVATRLAVEDFLISTVTAFRPSRRSNHFFSG